MSLYDVQEADEADGYPVHDREDPMCAWCGQFVATTRGWCDTCLDDEVR